jgi:DNA (cytosine-5)-methyltransferase 1
LGYGVKETVVDASKFGVPQTWKRLFITCELDNEPAPIRIPDRKIHTVHSILDPRGTWETTQLFKDGRAKATIKRADTAIEALGSNSPFLLVYYGSDGGGGWQSLDEPLRTVTTLDRFALVEKIRGTYRMRMLQPSELARAMGLPRENLRDRPQLISDWVRARFLTFS